MLLLRVWSVCPQNIAASYLFHQYGKTKSVALVLLDRPGLKGSQRDGKYLVSIETLACQETVSTLLREDVAASLDASMFSDTAAGTQPAGILNGVTPITAATAASTNPLEPMLTDLQNLAGEITDAGGSGNKRGANEKLFPSTSERPTAFLVLKLGKNIREGNFCE